MINAIINCPICQCLLTIEKIMGNIYYICKNYNCYNHSQKTPNYWYSLRNNENKVKLFSNENLIEFCMKINQIEFYYQGSSSWIRLNYEKEIEYQDIDFTFNVNNIVVDVTKLINRLLSLRNLL